MWLNLFFLLILCTAIFATQSTEVVYSSQNVDSARQQEEIVMAIVVEPGKIDCLYQIIKNPKFFSFEIDYQVNSFLALF